MHACQSVTPARKCVECTTIYQLYHLLEAIIYVEQYTHLSHFRSKMRFKTYISFLTGPKDDIRAGDTITQCEVIALDEGEFGSTWNIQNYIFCMLIICTIGMQENIEGMHQYIYTADLRPYIAISKIYNILINSNDATIL